MKLNQKIQAFLTKKKYKKHRLALRCMMSFMVALCVVGNLIMPAISMTLESLDPSYSLKNETVTYLSSESTPPASANSNAYNVGAVEKENETFNVVVNETYTNVEIYNSYYGGNVESYIAGSDPIDITFTLDYLKLLVESKDLASMDGSKAHLYIDIKTLLGADTTFVLSEASRTGIVTDANYSTTLPAGNFEITTDGYILIILTPEYIAQAEQSLKGTLTFSGKLSRSNTSSGDQSFNIGNQEVTVKFPDKKAELSNKWGTLNSDGTITWTVTINNNDKLDLSDYTFTDAMLDQATSVNINPSDAAQFDTGTKKLTFLPESANSGSITITYTTPVTNGQLAAGSVTNTAKLVDGEGNDRGEKSGYVGFDKKPVQSSKNGTQDYKSGTYGNTITWTITLANEYGVSLDGYVLKDNMLASAINNEIKVSPAGSLVSDGNGGYTLTGVGNAKNITITYQTTATPGEKYTNNVSLSYPVGTENSDGKTPADDKSQEITYDKESNLISLKKDGYATQDNGVGVVQWTITIGNPNKLNLEGYKVTDEMIAQAIKDGYDVTVGAGAELNSNNEIVFNSESKNHQTITVTYKTEITSEQLKKGVSNTATLTDEDDPKVEVDVPKDITFATPHLNVNKSVSADYQNGTYGNTLNWTINIQSVYGVSLEGFIVKDAMLDNAKTVTISPAGSLTKNSDGVYTLTGVGDANNIQIRYSTEAAGNTYYNNAADVYYPGDNPSTDDKIDSNGDNTADITYKDEGGLYGVSKWGNVTSQEDREITWHITITPSGGISLQEFEVYDGKFPVDAEGKPDLDQITFTPSSAKEYATAAIVNGVPTIIFDQNASGNYFNGNVELSYKEYLADGVSGKIENSVSNNKNNTVATYPVNYTERDTLDKNLNTWPNPEQVQSSAQIERILDWTTSITYDGSLVNKTYTDTLSVSNSSLASHTITDAQLDAILIYAKQYSYENPGTKLVAGTDYTVTNNGNTGFTITFLDTEANKNYNYINISYKTTAVANAYSGEYDSNNLVTYTFSNKAQFNNNTDEDNKFVINRQNPETHTVININAVKNWENADSVTKPANVQMVLMHSVNYGEWLPVKGSGTNYVLSTYDAYSSTDGVYTITLIESGSWRAALNNIPQKDVFAKADGTPGEELNYRYKLAEITPDGVTLLEGNVYEYGNGYFQIVETNNSGVNWNDANMTITNKYYPEKSLTPRKIWEGDEGKSSQISSLTYQLQYSFTNSQNNNDWYPVKKDDTTGEYVYDANGSTAGATILTEELAKSGVTIDSTDGSNIRWTGTGWTELPGMIIVDGNVKTLYYRVREVAADGVEIPANKQFTVSDGYYTISSEGTDTITNKFTKTINNTVNAEKLWSDENHILDGVIVQLQRKGTDTNTWKAYGENVVLNAENSWKTSWADLPNQSVDTATGTVVTYTYRVVEIGYVDSEGNQHKNVIDNNSQFAVGADGYYEATYSTTNDTWSYFDKGLKEFASGGSVYIKNTFYPVATTSVIPQKTWNDAGFVETDRPVSIVFTLQQRLGTGSWTNIDTITLTSADATNEGNLVWLGAAFENLPAEKIKFNEDGSFTKEYYQYQLVETGYTMADGVTSVTIASGATYFKTASGKYDITISSPSNNVYNITNTFKESVGILKHAVDSDGKKYTSIDMDELIEHKYTLKNSEGQDEEYYVFNWIIEFESGYNETVTDTSGGILSPVIDILPEGFELVEDSTKSGSNSSVNSETIDECLKQIAQYIGPYNPAPIFTWRKAYAVYMAGVANESDLWKSWNNQTLYFYDSEYDGNSLGTTFEYLNGIDEELKGKNVVIFNRPSTNQGALFPFITYSTKIKCSELDKQVANGTVTISNYAERYTIDSNKISNTDATASASLKVVNKVPKDLITKTYEPTLIPGYVQFSLDINPEARNLSSGATIDIQDLFKTLDYYDHDYSGGQWWTGANSDKLVDIIMNSIKLYEVDANGNRVELASNKYTLILDTGDNVDGGSALLQLQIPDETHIQVDYVYKLIANENTPSVIRGCKSSTRVNGRYVTMAPGLVPPSGDKVKFTNVASLKTDSAADESTVSATEYEISSSSGTISTNALPSIKKVNTGDYTINDLDATFLFAKYENGKWYYATKIDDTKRTATWTVTGVTGSAVPTDEALAEIHVQEAYEVALDQNTLYKLVEIKVPDDYEGSNLGFANPEAEFKAMILDYLNYGRTYFNNKDYSIFLNHYISTHYFVYNSTLAAYPSEVEPEDVMLIKAGGDIEIPNNQLIDINVKKQWINPTADVTDSSITVELYWSYTKSSTGYPADMQLATAEKLGLMQEDFSATKTIKVSDDAAEVWTQLPNGIDGKPIYYYIKETAYTIGGVTYTNDNDPENPSFKSESGEVCAFYPTYVGNAANDDETIINVNNSQQLMLKKVWKNSANDPMIVIPTDKVIVSIYGIDADGVKTDAPLFENIELSASNDWSADLTNLLTSDNALYKYVAYEAEESAGTTLDDYVVSCTFNINSSTGEIVVTNKNTAPTDASVTVSKEWSDGSALHNNETIKVTLYQSDREITNLSNLSGTLAALGTPKMSKINEDDTQEYEVYLNKDNNWTVTWTGLPLDNGDPSNPIPYYYYVLEDMSPTEVPEGFTTVSNADKYSAKYEITDGTATRTVFEVTNTRQAIVVEKVWKDDNNNTIADSDLPQSSIEVEVYTEGAPLKDSADMFQPDGCHPDNKGYETIANVFYSAIENYYTQNADKLPTDGLNVVAVGDSITYGYKDDDYNETVVSYPTTLTSLLTSKYTNVSVKSNATSGLEIDEFWYTDVNSNTDVICLLGGTNDMHQSDGTRGDVKQIYTNLTNLIKTLQNSDKAPNAVIFVGTIPYFDFYSDAGVITKGGSWWYNYDSSKHYNTNQTYADACNALIDEYNRYILNIASEYSNVYAVDVCSALPLVTKDKYIGEATLTAANGWKTAIDISDTDTSVKYYITEKNVPDGWQVTYSPESITLGSSTPITITNTKHIPETSIPVIKTWALDEGDESGRDAIQLTLLRSIDRTNWEEVDATLPTPVKEDDQWTFTFTNLPAEDNAGNQYYYMVEEGALPGYTVKYGTVITEAVDDGTANALTLTNTRAISLVVQKDWSDIDENDHINDIVKLKIYRTTKTEEFPTEGLELILQVPELISIGIDKPTDIKANKAITIKSVTTTNNCLEYTQSADGKTITVTGKAEGEAEIVVTDGVETKTITVKVSAVEMFLNNSSNFVITAGEEGTLSAEKNGAVVTNVTYTVEDGYEEIISIDGSTIKAIGYTTDSIDITATTSDGLSVTESITIALPESFAILGENSVDEGETINLTIDNPYGEFEWSSSDTSIATVDSNGTVTGKKPGDVVITAKRKDANGTTDTHSITVKESNPIFTGTTSGTNYFDIDVPDGKAVKSVTLSHAGSVQGWDEMLILIQNGNDVVHVKAYYDNGWNTGTCSEEQNTTSKDYPKNTYTDYELKIVDGALVLEFNDSFSADKVQIASCTQGNFSSPFAMNYTVMCVGTGDTDEGGDNEEGGDTDEGGGNEEGGNTGEGGDTGETDGPVTITVNDKSVEATSGSIGMYLKYTNTYLKDGSTIKICDKNGTEIETITIVKPYEEGNGKTRSFTSTAGSSTMLESLTQVGEISWGNSYQYLMQLKNVTQTLIITITPTDSYDDVFDLTLATTSSASFSLRDTSLTLSDAGTTEILADEDIAPLAEDGISTASLVSNLTFVAIAGNSETEVANVDIELSGTGEDKWLAEIDNLPAQDENGNTYYYWVEEVPVFSNYEVSYLFRDNDDTTTHVVNATQVDGTNEVDIVVRNTRQNNVTVEMPSTGGEGTTNYYIVGIIIMLVSAAALIVIKRRQMVER